jgi:hypothetical protein
MACTSGSVQTVADKTVAAKQQVDKLLQMLQSQAGSDKDKFYTEISQHLGSGNIKDPREIAYNSALKVEYTSEFSLDKIADVVTSALKTLGTVTDPQVLKPALSKEAIACYTDVVNTVAEAAKSSCSSASSLSFSMNRLSPGLYAFLYATSVNIKDDDTFGSEAVTATAIYYRFIQSIDDIKNEAAFGAALIDAASYQQMKALQAALVDDLSNGKIDIDTWTKKDTAYDVAVKKIWDRLQAEKFQPHLLQAAARALPTGPTVFQQLVRDAVQRLAAKGGAYLQAVEKSNARLGRGYF